MWSLYIYIVIYILCGHHLVLEIKNVVQNDIDSIPAPSMPAMTVMPALHIYALLWGTLEDVSYETSVSQQHNET